MTMFRSEIGSGLGELGGTPPRIPTNTAPPPPLLPGSARDTTLIAQFIGTVLLCHVTVNLNHPSRLMIEILEVNNVNTAINTVTYGTY